MDGCDGRRTGTRTTRTITRLQQSGLTTRLAGARLKDRVRIDHRSIDGGFHGKSVQLDSFVRVTQLTKSLPSSVLTGTRTGSTLTSGTIT